MASNNAVNICGFLLTDSGAWAPATCNTGVQQTGNKPATSLETVAGLLLVCGDIVSNPFFPHYFMTKMSRSEDEVVVVI